MNLFFVDTSALAKRYLIETGSDWVRSWIRAASGNEIIISETTFVEMQALLARRLREQSIVSHRVIRIRAAFLGHVKRDYLIIDVTNKIFVKASELVNQHPLRTLDAIQLACALEAMRTLNETITFVTADNNLLKAAADEGFLTDNPLNHP